MKIPHEFEAFDGATGFACTKMVEDTEGYGTDCGAPASDHMTEEELAVHTGTSSADDVTGGFDAGSRSQEKES